MSQQAQDLFIEYFQDNASEYSSTKLDIYRQLYSIYLADTADTNLKMLFQAIDRVIPYLRDKGLVIPANATKEVLNSIYAKAFMHDPIVAKFTDKTKKAFAVVSPVFTKTVSKLLDTNNELYDLARKLNPERLRHLSEEAKNMDAALQVKDSVDKILATIDEDDTKVKMVANNIILILSQLATDTETRQQILNQLSFTTQDGKTYTIRGGKKDDDDFDVYMNKLIRATTLISRSNGASQTNTLLGVPFIKGTTDVGDVMGVNNAHVQFTIAMNAVAEKYDEVLKKLEEQQQATTVSEDVKTDVEKLEEFKADVEAQREDINIADFIKQHQYILTRMVSMLDEKQLGQDMTKVENYDMLEVIVKLLKQDITDVSLLEKFQGMMNEAKSNIDARLTQLTEEVKNLSGLMAQGKLSEMLKDVERLTEEQKITKQLLEALPKGVSASLLSSVHALTTFMKMQNNSQRLENNLAKADSQNVYNSMLSKFLSLLVNAIQRGILKTVDVDNVPQERLNEIIGSYLEKGELYKHMQDRIQESILEQVKSYQDGVTQKLSAIETNAKEGSLTGDQLRGIINMAEDGKFLNDHTTKLEGLIANISQLISSRRQSGGNDTNKPQGDVTAKAKETRNKLDELKKQFRTITNNVAGLQERYEKFKQSTEITQDSSGKMIISSLKDLKDEQFEKAVLGLEVSLKEEGSKFVNDVSTIVKQSNDSLSKSLQTTQSILNVEPFNPSYDAKSTTLKKLIEGDYDQSGVAGMGLQNKLDTLSNIVTSSYNNAIALIKSLTEGIKQEREYKIRAAQANAKPGYPMQGYPPMYGDPYAQQRGGKLTNQDQLKEFKDVSTDIIEVINNDILQGIIQPVDMDFMRMSNPVIAAALSMEPSMFQMFYDEYVDTKTKRSPVVAANELTAKLAANKLVPKEVLAVNSFDKTIFVFVMLFVRLFALSITEKLIEKNMLTKLSTSLAVYLTCYTVILLLFAAFVNYDIYRMRILFNYINLHANGGKLLIHIVLLWTFSFLIFLMMWHVNTTEPSGVIVTALSSEDKADMMYRLEVITMIVWLFLLLTIMIF